MRRTDKRAGLSWMGRLCGALACGLGVWAGSGAAATNYYYVGAGTGATPYDSWGTSTNDIQTVVNKAVSDLGGGVTACIVTVTDGVFAVSSEIALNGAITLRSLNGAGSTTVKGNYPASTNRIFRISAANAVLDGFTVTNGYLNTTGQDGVGILITNAATVQNCVIVGNVGGASSYGGGVRITDGLIRNSVVAGNASGQGGGGYLGGSGVISNCTFSGNRSKTGWMRGGAMRMDGGTLDRCVISSNTVSDTGGGLQMYNGTTRNCLFYGNSAGGSGGGVYFGNGVVQNCTVADNSSSSTGGGVYQVGGTIRNTIVYFNTSVGSGNNLYLTAGTFTNSCVTPAYLNNVASDPQFASRSGRNYRLLPGSPCLDAGSATGTVNYDLDGNPRPTDGDGAGGAAYDIGAYEAAAASDDALRCNFIADSVSGFDSLNVQFTAQMAGSNRVGLAYRWALGDGTTNDWSGSATVAQTYGAGSFDVTLWVTNSAGETTSVAKGSYITVYPATVYVKPAGAPVWPFDTWEKAATNLQAAVDAAGVIGTSASVVLVTNGVYTLTNNVEVPKGIVVRGASREGVIINGNHAVRGFHVASAGAVIESLTVSNGYATGTSPACCGGGVYLEAGTLRNVTIRNCEAAVGGSFDGGGGINMLSGSVESNCLVTDNRVGANNSGAGILMIGGVLRDSVVTRNAFTSSGGGFGAGVFCRGGTISNCTVTFNTNMTYRGGGVYIENSGTSMTGCSIANNAAREGGGVWGNITLIDRCVIVSNSTLLATDAGGGASMRDTTLRNCGVWANSGYYGGGVYMVAGFPNSRLENCTIVGNSATLSGGGVYMDAGMATNTIVYFNRIGMTTDNNLAGAVTNYAYSCSPELQNGVAGNKTVDPMFARNGTGYGTAHVPGDYRLRYDSPCVDAGANLAWITGSSVDLYGGLRRVNDAVNMGAIESIWAPRGTIIMMQ